MALNCVQVDVYLVLIWCSLFVSLLKTVLVVGHLGWVVCFCFFAQAFSFPLLFLFFYDSLTVILDWVMPWKYLSCVYGFDWYSSMLYVPGAIPPCDLHYTIEQ